MEKRGLPLEASKALLNVTRGKGDFQSALSLLRKTKELLPLWIDSDTLVQTYKRYFNAILGSNNISLGNALSPFTLVSCWKSLQALIEENTQLRGELNAFIPEIFDRAEKAISDRSVGEGNLLGCLVDSLHPLGGEALPIATHIAYLIRPSQYPALTRDMLRHLEIDTPEEYLYFRDRVLEKGLKPMEAFTLLHMLLDTSPAKVRFLDDSLGIDRKDFLLRKAIRLWERDQFWEAHEVLEDLWCLEQDSEIKNALQGVIRVAIALHHLENGDRDASLRVLKKALPQLRCAVGTYFDVSSLRNGVCGLIETLERSQLPEALPVLRML